MSDLATVVGLRQVTRFVQQAHDRIVRAVTAKESKRVEDEAAALLEYARRLGLAEEAKNRLKIVIDAAQIRITELDGAVKESRGARTDRPGSQCVPGSAKAPARAEAGLTKSKVQACRQKAAAAKLPGFKEAQA